VADLLPVDRRRARRHGQCRISADTALRLVRFFGTSERFWINLQSRYDREVEKDRWAMSSMTSARLRPPVDIKSNLGCCLTGSLPSLYLFQLLLMMQALRYVEILASCSLAWRLHRR
jgi:hypothetical protein